MSPAERAERRRQLLESAAGVPALIEATLTNAVSDARRRGDESALQRLQAGAEQAVAAARRFIQAELAALGPEVAHPDLML